MQIETYFGFRGAMVDLVGGLGEFGLELFLWGLIVLVGVDRGCGGGVC